MPSRVQASLSCGPPSSTPPPFSPSSSWPQSFFSLTLNLMLLFPLLLTTQTPMLALSSNRRSEAPGLCWLSSPRNYPPLSPSIPPLTVYSWLAVYSAVNPFSARGETVHPVHRPKASDAHHVQVLSAVHLDLFTPGLDFSTLTALQSPCSSVPLAYSQDLVSVVNRVRSRPR